MIQKSHKHGHHKHHKRDNSNSRSRSNHRRHKDQKKRSKSKEYKQKQKEVPKLKLNTQMEENMEIENTNKSSKIEKLSNETPLATQSTRQPRKKFVYIKDLPKKPIKCKEYQQKCREISLVTNNYNVKFRENGVIVVYNCMFTPHIIIQNQNLKREIIRILEQQISKYLGPFCYYSGLLVALQEPQDFGFKIQQEIRFNNVDYTIEIKKNKVLQMSDLMNPDPEVQSKPLLFLNFIVKNLFKSIRYFEHGRKKQFHDIMRRKTIPETELSIVPGFAISLQNTESGFMFKIDVSHRIIRSITALQYIDKLYKEELDKRKSKEDIRRVVTYSLSKQMVLANYGTFRTYQVDDLLFDQNTSEYQMEVSDQLGKGTMMTIDQYFLERYQYQIKNKRAPLLIYVDPRNKKKLILVPELCIMAGIPDGLNEFTRRQIQKECQSNPSERFQKIEDIQNELFHRQPEEGLSIERLRTEFGIDISDKPTTIKAKQLKPPNIIVGNEQKVSPQNEVNNCQFLLQNCTAFCRNFDVQYAIIYLPEFDYDKFKTQLEQFTTNLGVRLKGKTIGHKVSDRRQNQVTEMESYLKNLDKNVNIVIITLNRFLKTQYSNLKKVCFSERCNVLSQMIQIDTINKKGVQIITLKIVMQALDKLGNSIWSVQQPQLWPKDTMIMSAIIEKSASGMLSSLDKDYIRYYSQVQRKGNDKCIIGDIKKFIINAFKAYYEVNKKYPENVIYFRDGLAEEGIQNVLKQEVPEIFEGALSIYPQYQKKLCLINIQNSQVTKLFKDERNSIFNAPAGTVVDHTIVSPTYEFLMVPVFSSRGCPRPILYRIVYDSLNLPMEQLQDFIYGQCYNYKNWQGPVKMPGIVKNCQRMVKFVNEVIMQEPSQQLKLTQFYL